MRIILLSLIICAFASCKKENVVACIQKSQNPAWETILFKYNYTIQLPQNYKGIGAIGFEGFYFNKYREDSTAIISYGYCGSLGCNAFGQPLSNPEPDFININNNLKLLNKKVKFCEGDSIIAILYYNEQDWRHARLYMGGDNFFREALDLQYHSSRQSEVEAILKTIQRQ